MIRSFTYSPRNGHTLVEVTAALALIAIVGAIVAQAIVITLRERVRSAMHHSALEMASNVLEDARAMPMEQLDKSWADAQVIPSDMANVLADGKLLVTVEPLKDSPSLTRVTAEVRWQFEAGTPAHRAALTTVFGVRTDAKKGAQP
jgi:prepilin-type N-terminal cleavage/methylation domain-containing protein